MPDENVQKEPETVPNELEETKKKSDEYLNNWKRATADLINYKKEEMERMAMLASYAKESALFEILPILDSVHLAQNHVPEEIKGNSWMQGFTQIQNQIWEFLKKAGIEEIKTVGEKFDPATMETIGQVEVEGKEHGDVIEELQKGYKMGDKILRPARVKISK